MYKVNTRQVAIISRDFVNDNEYVLVDKTLLTKVPVHGGNNRNDEPREGGRRMKERE